MIRPEATCLICESSYDAYRLVSNGCYYRCGGCGVYFLWPQPNAEVLGKYYEIMHGNYGGIDRSYDAWKKRLERDLRSKSQILARYVDFGRVGLRVLDYGCAYGHFLEILDRYPVRKWGCDVSEGALRIARRRFGASSEWIGNPADLPSNIETATMDCVTMWATLEHVTNPEVVVSSIAAVLKPGGILAVDTGVTDDRLSRMIRGNVQWFDAPQHLWVFTKGSMELLLCKAGFEIVFEDLRFERSTYRRFAKSVFVDLVAMTTRAIHRVVNLDDRKIPCGHTGLWIARKLAK